MDRSWGVKAMDASSMQAFAVFMQTASGVAAKWKKLPYRVLVANTRQQAVCPVSVQAACSRLQCLRLYYSILQHLQRHRTCAISPILGDSGVSDLSISISNIHLHLHLHIHCHGCHCTAPPTPSGLSDAAPPCSARRISINSSQRSSYQMRRIGR